MKKIWNKQLANHMVFILFGLMFVFILANNIFFEYVYHYDSCNKSPVPNMVLIPLSLLTFIVFVYLYKVKRINILTRFNLRYINMNIAIYVFSGFIFILQLFLLYNIYFTMKWDIGTITDTAIDISQNHIIVNQDYSQYWYYSLFPNNIFLTSLFARLISIGSVFSFISPKLFLALISMILVNVSGILVYKNTFKILKNPNYSFIVWILYTILHTFSAWSIVPYSDTFSILFTNFGLYLYLNRKTINPFFNAFLLPFILYIGMLIKPTVIILLIGIVIIETWTWLFNSKQKKLAKLLLIPFALLGLFLGTFGDTFAKKHLGFYGNREAEIPFTHFLMMGLNEKDGGAFSYDDYNFTRSFPTYEEKVDQNITVIKERIHDYGPSGLMKFFQAKSLMNFNDPSFALGAEANSFVNLSPEKIPGVSALMRSFTYQIGSNFHITMVWLKYLWGFIFTMILFAVPYLWKKKSNDLAVIAITIIGMCLFVTLFEGRARYLFLYFPYFLMIAGIGIMESSQRIEKLFKKMETKFNRT